MNGPRGYTQCIFWFTVTNPIKIAQDKVLWQVAQTKSKGGMHVKTQQCWTGRTKCRKECRQAKRIVAKLADWCRVVCRHVFFKTQNLCVDQEDKNRVRK